MASFKSSASSVRYDPIKVPDNAERMAREGKQRIDQLREAYQADINNRTQYAQGLKEDSARIERQINSNNQLEETFQRTYKEALQKRYNQKVKNARTEAEQQNAKLDSLNEFSSTLLNEAKKMKESANKEDEEFGSYLVYQYGVTPDELAALKSNESELEAENTANNAVVERLKASGASPDQIAAIRNLDGWRLYGAEKAMAENGGADFQQFMSDPTTRDKKFKLSNGELFSLKDAELAKDGALYKKIQNLAFQDWNKNYRHLDPAFATKYLYPNVRKVQTTDFLNFQSTVGQELELLTSAPLEQLHDDPLILAHRRHHELLQVHHPVHLLLQRLNEPGQIPLHRVVDSVHQRPARFRQRPFTQVHRPRTQRYVRGHVPGDVFGHLGNFGRQQLGYPPRVQLHEHLLHVDELVGDHGYHVVGHPRSLGGHDALPADGQRVEDVVAVHLSLHRLLQEGQAQEADGVEDHLHREPVGEPAHEGGDERDEYDPLRIGVELCLCVRTRPTDARRGGCQKTTEAVRPDHQRLQDGLRELTRDPYRSQAFHESCHERNLTPRGPRRGDGPENHQARDDDGGAREEPKPRMQVWPRSVVPILRIPIVHLTLAR